MLAFKKENMKEGPRASHGSGIGSLIKDRGNERTRKFPDATRDTSPVGIELNNNISKRAVILD